MELGQLQVPGRGLGAGRSEGLFVGGEGQVASGVGSSCRHLPQSGDYRVALALCRPTCAGARWSQGGLSQACAAQSLQVQPSEGAEQAADTALVLGPPLTSPRAKQRKPGDP